MDYILLYKDSKDVLHIKNNELNMSFSTLYKKKSIVFVSTKFNQYIIGLNRQQLVEFYRLVIYLYG